MKKIKKNDFKKLALLGIAGGTALASQVNASDASEIIPSQLLAFGGCGGQGSGQGGQGGCHSGNGGGYQAYRNPSNNYYYNQMPQSSCNSAPQAQYQAQPLQYQQIPQNYQQSSCSSASQPQYSNQSYTQGMQAPSGCANMSHPQHYNQNTQAPSGCASVSQPQYHQSPENTPNMSQPAPQISQSPQVSYGCGAMRPQMTRQMMAGCNSPRPNNGQMPNQPETPAPVDTPNDGVNKGQAYTQWETADNSRPSQTHGSSSMSPSSSNGTYDSTSGKSSTSKQKLSESDLTSQLNAQGKATYQGLDATGKALALKLANQDCKGHNECKGLNSCKTSEHTCAGKGSCAGTSEAPFKDKNLAVKVAGMKMAEKRAISK